jgi:hypothetical protein
MGGRLAVKHLALEDASVRGGTTGEGYISKVERVYVMARAMMSSHYTNVY